jgi:uncharacterized protein (TIGR00251 family)
MSFKYQKDDDAFLNVKVSWGAKSNQVMGLEEDYLKIRIQARPIKGLANQELIDFLSETFNIPKSKIYIKFGLTSKNKTVVFLDTPLQKIDEYFDGKTTNHHL